MTRHDLLARAESVTDRLRLGLLPAEHVSLAGYLGSRESLATGIPPWVPAEPMPDWSWPARHMLRYAPLTRQARVWLACICAERVLTHWTGESEPEEAIREARAWCRGEATTSEVRAAAYAADAAAWAAWAADAAADAAYAAYAAANAAADAAAWAADAAAWAAHAAAYAANAAAYAVVAAEKTGQAEALAAALLSGEVAQWTE